MLANRGGRIRVYEYEFELHVTHCKTQVRFPCSFFLSWKTGDKSVEDVNLIGAISDTIPFNSTLRLHLDVAFDESTQRFLQKKTILCVNLNSSGRPAQTRLIGVVSLDVSIALNTNNMSELRMYSLERCSDKNSSMMLSLKGTFIKELTARQISQTMGSPSPNKQTTNVPKSKSVIDRAAIRQRFGLTGARIPQSDNPLTNRSAEVTSQKNVAEFRLDKQRNAPAQNKANLDYIITMDKYEVKEQPTGQTQKQIRQDRILTIPILPLGLTKGPQTPSHRGANTDRADHDLWVAKIHENALQRKSQIMESSLREEIARLKAMCQSLNTQLSSEHIFRVKLEAELEHCRVENLQLKQSQRNLQRQISSGRPNEQQNVIRQLRRNIERLQNENTQKQSKITLLQQQVLNYTHSKLDQAMKIETLSHELDQVRFTPTHQEPQAKKIPLVRNDSLQFSLPCFAHESNVAHGPAQTQSKERKTITSLFQNIPPLYSNEDFKKKYDVNCSALPDQQLERALKIIEEFELRLQHTDRKYCEAKVQLEDLSADLKITRHNSIIKEEDLLKRMKLLSEQNSTLRDSLEPLAEKVNQKQLRLDDLSLILKYLEERNVKTEAHIEALQKEIAQGQIELGQSRKEVDIIINQTIPKKQQVSECMMRELSSKLIDHELHVRKLNSQMKKYETQITILKDKVQQYETTLSKEKKQGTALAQNHQDPTLQLQVRKFKNELHDSPADSDSSAKQTRHYRRKLDEAIKKQQASRLQIDELNVRNNLLQKYLKKFQAEVTNGKKIIQELSSKVCNHSSEVISVQQKADLQWQIKKLLIEKQRLEAKQDSHEDSRTRLRIEKERLQADNSQLRQQIQEIKQKIRHKNIDDIQKLDKDKHISELMNKLHELESKYIQSCRLASLHHSDTKALTEVVKRFNLVEQRQGLSLHELLVENRQLQQIIVALTFRNKELMESYKGIAIPKILSLRELSLQINKAKAKLLTIVASSEQKKSVILSLRPLQEKIHELVVNNQQAKAIKNLSESSADENEENAKTEF